MEANKSSVMLLFVKCTKDDVALNNLISRSKSLLYINLHGMHLRCLEDAVKPCNLWPILHAMQLRLIKDSAPAAAKPAAKKDKKDKKTDKSSKGVKKSKDKGKNGKGDKKGTSGKRKAKEMEE